MRVPRLEYSTKVYLVYRQAKVSCRAPVYALARGQPAAQVYVECSHSGWFFGCERVVNGCLQESSKKGNMSWTGVYECIRDPCVLVNRMGTGPAPAALL